MVERVSKIGSEGSAAPPRGPPFKDVQSFVKINLSTDNLKQALNLSALLQKSQADAQKLAKAEIAEAIASRGEVEKEREEDPVAALHKKPDKKSESKKSAREQKLESSSLYAIEAIASEEGIGDAKDSGTDESHGLGSSDAPPTNDPNALPPGLAQAYAEQMQDMQQFFNWILQGGNPQYAQLIQGYESALAKMSHPPTLADATQLNSMMQTMQTMAVTLPSNLLVAYFQLVNVLYGHMQQLAQSDINTLTPEIAELKNEIPILEELSNLLQQGTQAAYTLTNGIPTVATLEWMGQNIISLENLLQEVPPNSPLIATIQNVLSIWGSLTSKNPLFPPGMILGYSLFMTAMQKYASGSDRTQADISQVWNYFNAFNPLGIPGLESALTYIHIQFPSPAMVPTDWSYTSDGHVLINNNNFNKLMMEGMSTALGNCKSIYTSFEEAVTANQNQLSADNAELLILENLLNFASSALSFIDQMLQFAQGELPPPPSGSGNYVQSALLPLIQKELEGFLMLIHILEEYLPGAAFNKFISQVNAISSHLPNITMDDLNELNGLLGQLNTYAQQLPYKSYQATYWGAELDLFTTLSQIGSATQDDNSLIFNALSDMMAILKRMESGSFTMDDLQHLIDDIGTLMKNGQVLSYGDNNLISGFLDSLYNVMGSNFGNATGTNANLYNVIVLSMQYAMLQDYTKEYGSQATESGFQSYVDQFVSQLPSSGSPALTQLEVSLENVGDCIGPNALFQIGTVGPNGVLTLNSSALSDLSTAFLQGGLHPIGGVPGGWVMLMNILANVIDGYDPSKNGLTVFDAILSQISVAIDVCWAMLWKVDSLADLFRRVMLGKFMPEQEAMLIRYSNVLKFSDDAGQMLQDLLKVLAALANAKSDFAGVPTNPTDTAKMQQAIQTDEQAITAAIAMIQADLALMGRADFGSDPEVLADQAKLIQQLKDLEGNLQTAQGQLAKVAADLQNGSPTLAIDLNLLLNGDATLESPGGLTNIMDTALGDSQDYGNMSLTEEYTMQMLMSSVQQEWEIVSTCLDSLHDSYMTFAKAIYQ